MDEIVRQAIAKWPNVPHCYGWLGLDVRGAWRMRDEHAQRLNLPGEKLTQPTLVGFINRNYCVDEDGRWYFQNGPQRVYLSLEATPYIARTDPAEGLVVQTGETLLPIDGAYLTDSGELIVKSGEKVAQIDNRDLASVLETLERNGNLVSDEELMAWMEKPEGSLTLTYRGSMVTVEHLKAAEVAQHFGFVRQPRA